MKKGIIKKIHNQDNFIWFKIKPDVSIVYFIDEIAASIDDYKEGLSYPNKDIVFNKFVPKRIFFNVGDGTIYAIVIYNKDLIDLFLFKNNPKFKIFIKKMNKFFCYSTGKFL